MTRETREYIITELSCLRDLLKNEEDSSKRRTLRREIKKLEDTFEEEE